MITSMRRFLECKTRSLPPRSRSHFKVKYKKLTFHAHFISIELLIKSHKWMRYVRLSVRSSSPLSLTFMWPWVLSWPTDLISVFSATVKVSLNVPWGNIDSSWDVTWYTCMLNYIRTSSKIFVFIWALVNTIEVTFSIQSHCNLVKILIMMTSRLLSCTSHLGSKTRSSGLNSKTLGTLQMPHFTSNHHDSW